ncbi:hypothetical protein L9F63_005551 [Diploptera punctata]|uniref:Uncharacterized protein n=1 Tax=Diploptera punctata TaxID=6984 RepID=A0AAD7ZDA4_DIPPU|nr:hypothetical protein L9F63_005551 [Diploptera punctata]
MNPSITIVVAMLATFCRCFNNDVLRALWKMSNEVATENFSDLKCVCLITERATGAENYMFPIEIPVYYVHLPLQVTKNAVRLSPDQFEEYSWDILLLEPINAGCLAYIVQTSDIGFMVKAFARLFHTPKAINRNNRKYLYLPEKHIQEQEFNSNIKRLFESREMDFMPDLVVARVIFNSSPSDVGIISPLISDVSSNFTIELFTHRFIGPKPQSSEPVYLDTWIPEKGLVRKTNLYPDKISNMMGKQLTLISLNYPPPAVARVVNGTQVYDGYEYRVVFEWAKRNNFTWKGICYPDEWWGEIYENGTGWGITGHVSMDEADVGFTVLYLWYRDFRFLDFSSNYHMSELTTILPKPKRLPEWSIIIAPFNYEMWLAVGGSVLLCSTLLYLAYKISLKLLGDDINLKMFSNWGWCFLCMTQILVEQAPDGNLNSNKKGHSAMRHLITWFILLYYLVTTAYAGGLACILTLPRYESPIDNIEQMADQNSKWGTSSDDCWIYFLKDSHNPKMRKVARNFIIGSDEFIGEMAEKAEMGFAVEKMMGGYFALPFYIHERTMKKLRLMKEPYTAQHTVFHVRKGSPYKKSLNVNLQRARDAGLFHFWEGLAARNYLNFRDQLSVITSNAQEEPDTTPLHVQHITVS